jgi:hypothetical protein
VDIEKKKINGDPYFKSPLENTLEVDLIKGEDGEIEDDSIIEYRSPKAEDGEGDKITLSFDLKGKDFLVAFQNVDNSFTLNIDRYLMEHES